MAELGVVASLSAVGVGVLGVLHGRLPRLALTSLAFPAGASAFLVVALVQLVVAGTVFPRSALMATGAVGLVGFGVAAARRRLGIESLTILVLALAGAALVVLVAFTQHLTRLTPDSLDHVMIAADLRGPEAMTQIRPDDMLKRQVGLAMLHTLSDLTERDYLTSLSPMLGASAFAFFAWFLWARTAGLATRRRWGWGALAVLFLLSTNRMLFHAFYLNVHIAVALLILVAVAGAWMAVVDRDPAWAPVAGVALAMTVLFRPEAPLVAALLLVPLAASRVPMLVRWWSAAPLLAVTLPWYALLWRYAPGGGEISPTAPVFGNILIVVGACSLVLVGGTARFGGLARTADRFVLWALLGLLAVRALLDPAILGNTLWATAVNLGPDVTLRFSPGGSGLWLLTWTAAVAIAALAVLVHRVPAGRLWTTPILGFGVLFLLMPYLRGSPWRIGSGDSGNRIVSHILFVIIAFAVLAALSVGQRDDDQQAVAPSG